jgi:hypothetical protein
VVIVKTIDVARAGLENPRVLFVWYASIQFALIMALWFFGPWGSDRYSIVLLPPLIAILASSPLKSNVALAGITVLLAVSMLVAWNETQTSRAIAQGVAWLRARDIPLASIDGGYVFNGWNLYAHPQNLLAGAAPQTDVPLVTSRENKPYVIAASPLPGYRVLREYSWSIPFRSLDYKVYVLQEVPTRSNGGG